MLRSIGSLARRGAAWTLLLALLLRGMIPGGFMPNIDPGNGKGWLVICTGMGEASIQLDDDDGAPAAPADTAHQGLCPFMAMSLLGPVLLLVALLPHRRGDARTLRPVMTALCRRLWSCVPLGARAPPALPAA